MPYFVDWIGRLFARRARLETGLTVFDIHRAVIHWRAAKRSAAVFLRAIA